jgi:nitrate/nitrite-specific signal transduction histidine kinase
MLVLACAVAWPATAQPTAPSAAGTMTPLAAVNQAGRQRMLSQRMAKAYLMIALDVQAEKWQTVLDESVALFISQLAALKTYTPTNDVRMALIQLEREWNIYEPLVTAPPNRIRAEKVYLVSESLQLAAHRLTLAYESASGRPDRLLNYAGRQRMLTERMAKFFLFQALDIQPGGAQMELNMARAEFATGLQLLARAPQTPQLKLMLKVLDSEWIEYRKALEKSPRPGDATTIAEIAERSEQILAVAERIVALLQQQLERESPPLPPAVR